MGRKAIPSHRKMYKLNSRIDGQTRAEAQLGEFLSRWAEKEGITRGALIERVMLRAAKRQGYKPKE